MGDKNLIQQAYLFCSIPHPSMVELAATEGFAGVVIDDEKFHASPETVQSMCLAAEKWHLQALMRLRVATSERVEYALNLGIDTVLLPRLTSIDQVGPLAASAQWPPRGTRGYGHSRASLFKVGEHEKTPQIQVIMETVELLADVEKIAELENVAGLDIGTLDLAAALGRPADLEDRELRSAVTRVISAARASDKTVCMSVPNLRVAREWMAIGLTGFILEPFALMRESIQSQLSSIDTKG